ncbi:hypothetical protein Tco_0142164, partial [Tanacetum coccineum]
LDLLYEDLEQIDDLDIEEMDINWRIAMIAIRMKKFYKKTGRRVWIDGNKPVGFDKKKLECFKCHNTEEEVETNHALMAISSNNEDHPLKNMEDRGGSVTFGGSKGYITGKGRIRVGNLDFDGVRQHNMYSFDMKTPSLTKDYACLIAKPHLMNLNCGTGG